MLESNSKDRNSSDSRATMSFKEVMQEFDRRMKIRQAEEADFLQLLQNNENEEDEDED
jgi:hypothetical protein